MRRYTDRGGDDGSRPATATAALGRVSTALVPVSFWTAVCLPAVLVGLLLAGIETRVEAVTFLAVVAVEVLALVVGQAYRPA